MNKLQIFWQFLRELFCRHDCMLAADPRKEVICIHVVCPRCKKLFGHFHIPTPRFSKESLH